MPHPLQNILNPTLLLPPHHPRIPHDLQRPDQEHASERHPARPALQVSLRVEIAQHERDAGADAVGHVRDGGLPAVALGLVAVGLGIGIGGGEKGRDGGAAEPSFAVDQVQEEHEADAAVDAPCAGDEEVLVPVDDGGLGGGIVDQFGVAEGGKFLQHGVGPGLQLGVQGNGFLEPGFQLLLGGFVAEVEGLVGFRGGGSDFGELGYGHG